MSKGKSNSEQKTDVVSRPDQARQEVRNRQVPRGGKKPNVTLADIVAGFEERKLNSIVTLACNYRSPNGLFGNISELLPTRDCCHVQEQWLFQKLPKCIETLLKPDSPWTDDRRAAEGLAEYHAEWIEGIVPEDGRYQLHGDLTCPRCMFLLGLEHGWGFGANSQPRLALERVQGESVTNENNAKKIRLPAVHQIAKYAIDTMPRCEKKTVAAVMEHFAKLAAETTGGLVDRDFDVDGKTFSVTGIAEIETDRRGMRRRGTLACQFTDGARFTIDANQVENAVTGLLRPTSPG